MAVAAYRDRSYGRYPISLAQLRVSAGVLFGAEPPQDVLDMLGVDPVQAVAPPAYDPATQTVSEGQPEQAGGTWRQTWMVTDLPTPPTPVVELFPADLWRRATEAEAEAIEAAMAGQTAKLRNIFTRSSVFRSDDEFWPVLVGAATALFGEARAAELLAPS